MGLISDCLLSKVVLFSSVYLQVPVSIQFPANFTVPFQIDPAVGIVVNQGTYLHGILIADGAGSADYRTAHAAHTSKHNATEDSKGFLHFAA